MKKTKWIVGLSLASLIALSGTAFALNSRTTVAQTTRQAQSAPVVAPSTSDANGYGGGYGMMGGYGTNGTGRGNGMMGGYGANGTGGGYGMMGGYGANGAGGGYGMMGGYGANGTSGVNGMMGGFGANGNVGNGK